MKKISFLVLALALGFTLSACGPKTAEKNLDRGYRAPDIKGGVQNETFIGSLNDLIKRNQPLKCTYSNGTDGSGVVYIKGDQARVEINTEVDGEKIIMNSLKLGTWQYMWKEGEKVGTKFNFTEEEMKEMQEKAKEYNKPEAGNTVDFDSQLEYSCLPWSFDQSTFAVPGDVQFTDMTSAMKKTLSEMDVQIKSVCAACNNLSGTSKTECLKLCQ